MIKSERVAKIDASIILALNDLNKRKFKSVSQADIIAEMERRQNYCSITRRPTKPNNCRRKAPEKWIVRMTATGNPVSHDYIREMAQEIQNNHMKRLEGTDGPRLTVDVRCINVEEARLYVEEYLNVFN